MYKRLTVPTPEGYEADGLMATERLGRLEDVIDRLMKEYNQTLQALEQLQAKGKAQTAVGRSLEENKQSLQELLLRLGCL